MKDCGPQLYNMYRRPADTDGFVNMSLYVRHSYESGLSSLGILRVPKYQVLLNLMYLPYQRHQTSLAAYMQ
jgi:hypothetical protein